MTQVEIEILEELKRVYDPEIRVNIVDLGLIYSLTLSEEGHLQVVMTLTAPSCPVSGQIVADVRRAAQRHPQVKNAEVELVWDPPWDRDMMTEEAKLMLGFA